jgi:voltage-gated potassium channel
MNATAAESAVWVRRWERASEWPLMIAALVFLAAWAVPILDPHLPSWMLDLCRCLSWITCGIFVVDIVGRSPLADERLRYLVSALVRRLGDCPAAAPAAAAGPC